MPIQIVNARPDGGIESDLPQDWAPGTGERITIMIHGMRYAPGAGVDCPHRTLYALAPLPHARRVVSWSRKLGLGRQGCGIGFGWPATGPVWRAYAAAESSGAALAGLIRRLRASGAGPVDILAHSLGARVALSALPALSEGDVGRLLLLTAAEFHRPCIEALASPAGRAAEVLNVTSRENDLFDGLLELAFGAGLRGLGAALGSGLAAENAVTFQIDSPGHRQALAGLGYRIDWHGRRICHWSAYLRPGMFPIYRAVLDGRLPLSLLRATLPGESAPRWSRLFGTLPVQAHPAE